MGNASKFRPSLMAAMPEPSLLASPHSTHTYFSSLENIFSHYEKCIYLIIRQMYFRPSLVAANAVYWFRSHLLRPPHIPPTPIFSLLFSRICPTIKHSSVKMYFIIMNT